MAQTQRFGKLFFKIMNRESEILRKKYISESGAFPYLICVSVSQTQIEEKNHYPVADCPLGLKTRSKSQIFVILRM
jgi:hypothetical protein